MRGIVFLGDRKLEVREFPDPTPGPRDVILEIKASGMCGTDLRPYRTQPRFDELYIAGHEPCGIVAEIGSAVSSTEAQVGDRVMVHHYDGCGVCRHCQSGWTQLCQDDPVWYGSGRGHGAHAKYMKVAAHTVLPLPEELSFKTGAAVGCGTGTAYGAIKRLNVEGDETLAVFGQGPVGLSATQLGSAMGARIIAVDISPERRQMALDNGADVVIDPTEVDPVEAILELTHGEGAHKSMDTSSAEEARVASVRSVRTWGSACFVGVGGEVTLQVSADLVLRQVSVIGHLTFSKMWQSDCARFVADRGIDVDGLFSHEWDLNQAEEAYQLFDQQKTGKGVFVPA